MTEFPYVGPPSDGLQLAMATARSRRLRAAGFNGSATALVLAVVAVLAGSNGQQTLLQQPAPDLPAVVSVDKVPSTSGQGPTANTVDGAQIADFGAGSAASGRTVRPDTAASSGATADPPAGLTTQSSRAGGEELSATPYRSAAMKRDDGNSINLPTQPECTVRNDGSTRTSPLCPSAYPRSQAAPAAAFSLETSVCSSDTKSTVLHYASEREVDLVVFKGSRAVWHWSSTQPAARPTPHSLTLGATSCYGWTTPWTAVDDDGAALPAGSDYRLVASFGAAEISDFSTYESSTFTIS